MYNNNPAVISHSPGKKLRFEPLLRITGHSVPLFSQKWMVLKGLPMATERLGQTQRSKDVSDITGQLPKQNIKWGSLRQSWGWREFQFVKLYHQREEFLPTEHNTYSSMGFGQSPEMRRPTSVFPVLACLPVRKEAT